MLDSLKKRPGSLRWAPRQRFTPTDTGRQALADYREAVEKHQSFDRSREGLEKLQKDWSASYKVEPPDAAILAEFAVKDRQPREVQTALADCGTTLPEVQAAVDRLYLAGLLAPVGGGGPIPPGQRRDEE
ncbi:MAG: hypothetical protein ACK4N5_13265 [Myxococcales bacterium]